MILNLNEKNPAVLLDVVRRAFIESPSVVRFELVGPGNMLHDTALMLFDELQNRPQGMRLHIDSRTSLFDGAVLIWLSGDTRTMRRDAWIQLSEIPETPANGKTLDGECDYRGSIIAQDEDPTDTDLRTIMDHLSEWLPVDEVAGLRMFPQDMRDLGLLDGEIETETLAGLFNRKRVLVRK